MGKFTQISVEEVLARTKLQLRIVDTTEHDSYLQLMILEAVRALGTLSGFTKKQCEINIIDKKSELPKDFYRLLGIRATATPLSNGNNPFLSANSNCVTQVYVDKRFLNDCGCDITSNMTVDFNNGFQIQNGFVFWNSDINSSGAKATLAYLALNTDSSGRLMIYEDYERAVSNYACYQFTLSYPELYNVGISDRYKREWVAQKAWVRGNDAAASFQQNKHEVMAVMNSLLVSPIYNY
jgi:hypothetical protein